MIPGKIIIFIQPFQQRYRSQDSNTLCYDKKCYQCNYIREKKSQTVGETILVILYTVSRSYFQVEIRVSYKDDYFFVNRYHAEQL